MHEDANASAPDFYLGKRACKEKTSGFPATLIGQDREIDESTMPKRVSNYLPPLGSTGRL